MWPFSRKPKSTPPRPDDLEHAREIRKTASNDLAELRRQAPAVERLTARLVERRALNHFGDDLLISFKPKGDHA